jgi:hypothetical protein
LPIVDPVPRKEPPTLGIIVPRAVILNKDICAKQGFGALSEWNGQFSSASADQAFQAMASLGSNSIALTTRIWTDSRTGNDVLAVPAKTESDASLLAGFQKAHAAGLDVVFKPGITGLDGTISHRVWRRRISMRVLRVLQGRDRAPGRNCEQGGVASFAIGNEMSSLSGDAYRSYWTDIISSVRGVYHGEVTYSAATDEASKVSFWDQVDTIGINAYPPLDGQHDADGGRSRCTLGMRCRIIRITPRPSTTSRPSISFIRCR